MLKVFYTARAYNGSELNKPWIPACLSDKQLSISLTLGKT